MKFIPAIDIKDNNCVRLQKGKEEDLTIFNNNPVEQAKFFEKKGCERIHLVDLDGAFGKPNINKETILKIRKETNCSIELGGGIRNQEDISFWINKGINFLVIGSLAVRNKNLILKMAEKNKGKIYIAADVLANKLMIKGWKESSNLSTSDIISFYNNSHISGYIFTDISRDGMLEGLNIDLIKDFALQTKKKIIVGGGLSNYEDLYNLKKINLSNLEGVIAGKSFYLGKIEINKALLIMSQNA